MITLKGGNTEGMIWVRRLKRGITGGMILMHQPVGDKVITIA